MTEHTAKPHLPALPVLNAAHCLMTRIEAVRQAPPWAPGRREEAIRMAYLQPGTDDNWCIAEVDIFQDLSGAEMDAIAAAAPMRTYAAGELVYTPGSPQESLFILKTGRVRVFRVSADGRALTTAIITPGTIFGEMTLLGQHMHDNYAEALDESVVCVMNREDVRRFLLSDARIATRISEILGRRLIFMERRVSDAVFKSVPQRLAKTLLVLTGQQRRKGFGSGSATIALTHAQLAALVGTSRNTATTILGEFADAGLIRLSRGKITVTDPQRLAAEIGD